MNDFQIKNLFFERSELAISALSEKYSNYLHTIARNVLKDADDADECVNDAYLKTWNSIPPNNPDNLKAYTARITRNLALDMLDSKHAQKRGGTETDLVLDEISEFVGKDGDPSEGLEMEELTACINRFLEGLDPDKRKMFMRRYWYMDDIREISKKFRKSESNVKTTLFRIREQLKEALQNEGINI